MDSCLGNVFYDKQWFHILTRIAYILMIISVALVLFRRLPAKAGCVPWRLWRFFHILFYIAYLLLSAHIIIYAYGYSYEYINFNVDPVIYIAKDTANYIPFMHFVLSVYLFFFGCLAIIIRIYKCLHRLIFEDKWIITKAEWINSRTYLIETEFITKKSKNKKIMNNESSSDNYPDMTTSLLGNEKESGEKREENENGILGEEGGDEMVRDCM